MWPETKINATQSKAKAIFIIKEFILTCKYVRNRCTNHIESNVHDLNCEREETLNMHRNHFHKWAEHCVNTMLTFLDLNFYGFSDVSSLSKKFKPKSSLSKSSSQKIIASSLGKLPKSLA